LIGIGGTMFAVLMLFQPPGSASFSPWLAVAVAYPLLLVGIFLMHGFCWYLGLQYRDYQPHFGWVLQSHSATAPEPRSRQGFYVGPTAETPAARRARLQNTKPTRAIPVPPGQAVTPPPPVPPQR
jgi:hypothetical protein